MLWASARLCVLVVCQSTGMSSPIERYAEIVPETAPELGKDQLQVVEWLPSALPMGQCLFVTGKAGTGKSTLLRYLASQLSLAHVVVAPTGIAAINVGGQTVHSFFRLRPGPLIDKDEDVTLFRKGSPKSRLIKAMQVLIIDEISMVRADLMDAIDWSLRLNTGCEEPFGGKLCVFFGDLWQLEPVVTRGAEEAMIRDRYRSPFFFDAEVFARARLRSFELQTVYRQEGDPEFLEALNAIRRGDPSPLELINERVGQPLRDGAVITLTATNIRASTINQTRLAALGGTHRNYLANVTQEFGTEFPTDPHLTLKPGAQVMFVRNGRQWVNGTLGTVKSVIDGEVTVTLEDGEDVAVSPVTWEKCAYDWDASAKRITRRVVGTFTQIPLKLAWAVTVHKSQGLTFDRVNIDFDRHAFAHGQLYVALSRCRSLAGISLCRPLSPRDMVLHPRVAEFEWEQGLDG